MDFDGDKYIEWEDFTSYLIETATDQSFTIASIKDYGWKKTLSNSEVEDSVKKICYFDEWDKIVTCGKSKKVRILDPDNDYQTIATLPDHDGTILNAEYIPHPYNLLVTSSADLCLRFWDARNKDFDQKLNQQMEASQTVIKYYQKHDILFTASRTGDVHYWKWGYNDDVPKKKKTNDSAQKATIINKSMADKKQQANNSVINMNNSDREMFYVVDTMHKVHVDNITDMLLLPKENRLVTCSTDKTIKMTDIDKKEVIITLKGHKQGVFAVTWCSEYQFLISAGFEHEALVWTSNIDAHPFKLKDQRRPHQHSLVNVYAVPHSPQVITADHKGMVKIWDVRTFNCVQTIYTESNLPKNDYHSFYLSSFTYMDKRKEIISAGKRIHVYEYERTSNPNLADDQPISMCIYNALNFTFLSVAGCDIKVWDALTGCVQKIYKDISSSEITALTLDDRGRKFFIGNHRGEITAHNAINGALVKTFGKHSQEVTSLTYTDDSTNTSWDKQVRILSDRDNNDGMDARKDPFTNHTHDVKVSCYHKQQCVAATGDVNGRVLIFDIRSLKWLLECSDHSGVSVSSAPILTSKQEITALKFMGSLPAFISADSTGALHIWTIKPYPINPYKKLKKWRNHTFTPPRMSMRNPFMTQNKTFDEYNDDDDDVNVLSVPQIPLGDDQTSIPVTCMDFDTGSNSLYTGDEKGYIVCWDLDVLVTKASLKSSGRNTTGTGASTINVTQLKENWDNLKTLDIPRKFFWKAHSDCIKTIQIIKDPSSVVSAGHDSAIKIWSKEGEMMDCLRQDRKDIHNDEYKRLKKDMDLSEFKQFNFPVNLEKRRVEDAHTVSNVINRIKKQLRIISLWKTKSKSALVQQNTDRSNTSMSDDHDMYDYNEESGEESEEEEFSPVPPPAAFEDDLMNLKSKEQADLMEIIKRNRSRNKMRDGSPSHRQVVRAHSQISYAGRLSRNSSPLTRSSSPSLKLPILRKTPTDE
ncbi:hypothetical protein AKO1_013558 [Acrasis kona]|uniref:EF-hand domain-containing protein n=1 Tax=Acrasis kona TaxID=1008807 RepID=A0AAW2ZG52_9EUKA